MSAFKEITNNYSCISTHLFVFKSQREVIFRSRICNYSVRLTKKDLIGCINYFIDALKMLGYGDKIKVGFNLPVFKYFELSVYLHGLIQLYCSIIKCSPIGDLCITRFSHLPHDIMLPEKQTLEIDCVLVKDARFPFSLYVCCVYGQSFCSSHLPALEGHIRVSVPRLFKKYNLIFKVRE